MIRIGVNLTEHELVLMDLQERRFLFVIGVGYFCFALIKQC